MATQDQEAYLRSLERSVARGTRYFFPTPRNRAGVQATNLGGGPSTTISRAAGQLSPVNAGPINFTVTFSEPATGFVNADVSFSGSTVGGTPAAAVTGGPTIYNVAVTGMTGDGNVTISIASGLVTTTAKGLPFPASNSATVVFDTTRPSVTINVAAGQADPAIVAGAAINFTAVFSEAVTGFIAADVSLSGTATGTLVAAVTGGPSTYNVAVTGMTGAGTVIASIPANGAIDAAGNLNFASTSTDNTVQYSPDTTVPTVTINKGAAQPDPTSSSPILFDVVFSEVVVGFVAADVTLTDTTGGALVAVISGTGPTYTVSVTGMGASNGNVTASIPAASVTDLAGNANTASTSTDNIVAWTPVTGATAQSYFFEAAQY